jgi:hypothetical protein
MVYVIIIALIFVAVLIYLQWQYLKSQPKGSELKTINDNQIFLSEKLDKILEAIKNVPKTDGDRPRERTLEEVLAEIVTIKEEANGVSSPSAPPPSASDVKTGTGKEKMAWARAVIGLKKREKVRSFKGQKKSDGVGNTDAANTAK